MGTQTLRQQLGATKKELRIAESLLGTNVEYKQVNQKRKDTRKEENALRRESDKLEDKINLKFLTRANESPSYTRGGYFGAQTNIRYAVQNAIGQVAPLSKLKASQIEDITRTLIKKERANTPRLREIAQRLEELRLEDSKLYNRKCELESSVDNLKAKVETIKDDIRRENFKKTPEYQVELVKEQEKRETEQARARAIINVDEIYEIHEKLSKQPADSA